MQRDIEIKFSLTSCCLVLVLTPVLIIGAVQIALACTAARAAQMIVIYKEKERCGFSKVINDSNSYYYFTPFM